MLMRAIMAPQGSYMTSTPASRAWCNGIHPSPAPFTASFALCGPNLCLHTPARCHATGHFQGSPSTPSAHIPEHVPASSSPQASGGFRTVIQRFDYDFCSLALLSIRFQACQSALVYRTASISAAFSCCCFGHRGIEVSLAWLTSAAVQASHSWV